MKSQHKFKDIQFQDWPITTNRFGKPVVPAVLENAEFMLGVNGIALRFNKLTKDIEVTHDQGEFCSELAPNADLAVIVSLASFYGFKEHLIERYVTPIAAKNSYCPVTIWIDSKPWDGEDRITALIHTIKTQYDYPQELKKTLITKWLVSGAAAVSMETGFSTRGVLTLRGGQGIGKTRWIASLVDEPVLAKQAVKLDYHADSSNKDNVITATKRWILEIGELDASLKKDVARLKGFLTAQEDYVRVPYERRPVSYPRRVICAASVNDANFLIDETGNSRFWTLDCVEINHKHCIDMQQLWAQAKELYLKGHTWWLSLEEEAQLTKQNLNYRSVSVIREAILEQLHFDARPDSYQRVTASGLLRQLGIEKIDNRSTRECGAILRELFGEPAGVTHGCSTWLVPPKPDDYELWCRQNPSDTPTTPEEIAEAERLLKS